MAKADLTAERLRELLDYRPETGVFKWKVRPTSNRVNVGDLAGAVNCYGYVRFAVDGRDYAAHRLAWLYVHGEWPKHSVDHINRNRADNRIANLRDVSRTENNQNRIATRPLAGATKHRGRWMAQIQVNGEKRYLGHFDTQEAAHFAYVSAKRGMHPTWTS